MAQAVRQPFNAKGKFVAGAKGLRFHGKTYAPGDNFPWRKLSCSERKLRQLHERRLVEYSDDFDPDKAYKMPVEEATTDETPSGEVFVFDPSKHLVHSPKRGKFEVIDENEEVLLEIDKDLAKELKKAQEPIEIELEE